MPNDPPQLSETAFPKGFDYQPESVVGKRILVTGGTTGIGRAAALLLVARGAKVLIFGRHEEELNHALRDIKGVGGGEIYGTLGDSSNPEDVKKIFEEVDRRLGGLDILINNAALGAGSILDSEPDEWQQVLNTNLLGYFACCREVADRMKPNGDGHIVNIGSMSAKARDAGSDVYVATKSGIQGFTDSLARQLNCDGIRVTLIEPGLVGTDMTTDQVEAEKQEEAQEKWEMLKAEDLAQCIYYCLQQPKRCDVAVIQIRPTKQII